MINTSRPRQNGRRFADDTFKRIFLNENARISIEISLKFVPKGPIKNNPALVQIMAWRRIGDKPLSEPMMVSLLTHICVTRPQWVLILCTCVCKAGAINRYLGLLVVLHLTLYHFWKSWYTELQNTDKTISIPTMYLMFPVILTGHRLMPLTKDQ